MKQTLFSEGWPSAFTAGKWVGSALTRLVTRVGLVDDVEPALPADYLAVGMALLRGLEGRDDFHGKPSKTGNAPGTVNPCFPNPRHSSARGHVFQNFQPAVRRVRLDQDAGQGRSAELDDTALMGAARILDLMTQKTSVAVVEKQDDSRRTVPGQLHLGDENVEAAVPVEIRHHQTVQMGKVVAK